MTGSASTRVVLAFDGRPSSTAAIPWLAARGFEVVTLTVDVGQGGELLGLRERALASGAVRAHVLDAREEFARQCVLPLIQRGDVSLDLARAGAVEARRLLAGRLLDVVNMENAGAVAHGGGDRSAIDAALAEAARPITVLHVPDEQEHASASTLIGRYEEIAAGPAETYRLTRSHADRPAEAAFVSVDVAGGVPVRANGIEMSLVELIDSLETIAGAHGVGRREGITAQGRRYVSEAPAGAVLQAAFAALRSHAAGSVRLRLLDGDCSVIDITPVEH